MIVLVTKHEQVFICYEIKCICVQIYAVVVAGSGDGGGGGCRSGSWRVRSRLLWR